MLCGVVTEPSICRPYKCCQRPGSRQQQFVQSFLGQTQEDACLPISHSRSLARARPTLESMCVHRSQTKRPCGMMCLSVAAVRGSRGLACVMFSPYIKECNYGFRINKISSRLTKFLVNTSHIYGSRIIYYENTFRN